MTQGLYTVRVLAGEHQGRYRKYVAGDVFQTKHPLHEMFVGKFELIPSAPAPVEEGPASSPLPTSLPQAKTPSPAMGPYGEYKGDNTGIKDPFGMPSPQSALPYDFASATDVTHLFKEAKELGLTVYKDSSGGYAVAEAGVPVPVNLAPSVLSSKKKVSEYLGSMKLPDTGD